MLIKRGKPPVAASCTFLALSTVLIFHRHHFIVAGIEPSMGANAGETDRDLAASHKFTVYQNTAKLKYSIVLNIINKLTL
jgi:hypothetical protein